MNNWTREGIKRHAKLFLKSNYWTAFAVCLIAVLLGASLRSFEVFSRFGGRSSGEAAHIFMQLRHGFGVWTDVFTRPIGALVSGFWGLFTLGITLVVIALRVIVGNNLRVGQARYFNHAIGGDNKFDYLFSTFTRGEWAGHSVKLLWLDIVIMLWSLLLVIPGIVKYYQYKFVPYILADHPEYSIQQAMNVSTEMTRDDKTNLFVLSLSFIGWYILGSLLLGIGQYFVEPYPIATEATLYRIKKEGLKYQIL